MQHFIMSSNVNSEPFETTFATVTIKPEPDCQIFSPITEVVRQNSCSEFNVKVEPPYDIEFVAVPGNEGPTFIKKEEVNVTSSSPLILNEPNLCTLNWDCATEGDVCCSCSYTPGDRYDYETLATRVFSCNKCNPTSAEERKQFTCNICKYKCLEQCNLDRHMKNNHTSAATYACTGCEYTTTEQHSLTKHLILHTGEEPYACKQYNYKDTDKSKQLSQYSFSCSMCEYKTPDKSTLRRHMMVHTGEKPFVCNLCDYKTAQKHSLTKHKRIHTGEKPFTCPICELKTSDKSSLNRHMRLHDGAKPYTCSLCDYRSRERNGLERHLVRMHTNMKPLKCELCDYRAVEATSLKKHHMRVHTLERPFGCTLCKYRSSEKRNVDRHMLLHGKRALCTEKSKSQVPEASDQ